ncbi:unnamed protein product [Caenorhabditis sp. 36 PRJEB53466]|nr:unnamed protein product [Caenorhabditis sp. 36 PRJEB53466]
MCSRRLVALLAFCAAASAVDTEGTNFVFAFVRNANNNITNQVLSATVLNRNSEDCKFTLTYRPDYHKTTPAENITQTVPSLSAINVDIPSWYGWDYAGNNVQDDVFLTLTGYSTCLVTVLANNYDNVTQQGDTYLVLPATWGSQSFTFSLPPAVISLDQQYEQVFVLPTSDGTTQVIFSEIGNTQSVFYFNATYGDSPAVYVGASTPDSRPRTYHVITDKPVLIVAGVTCAGVDANTCDHVAYMPHPPAASDCYAYDYYDDDHISYLPTTSQFFTDIPGTCLVRQNITATLNDGTYSVMSVKSQMESPLWTIQTTNTNQKGVAFHNGGTNAHIARYYDGSKYNVRGAFISTVPSIPQFHNDYTSFYTRNANDSVEIYCTVLTCAALTLDGSGVYNLANEMTTQKVDGISYYIFVITVAQPGFHQLDLDPGKNGNYAFFVFGKNGQYSYGYEGGVNKPTFVLAPATTPGSTTNSTAPTATPITVTVPTVTVPTVTVPTVTVPTVTVPTVTVPPVTTTTTAPGTAGTTPTAAPATATPSTVTPGTSKQTNPATSQSAATTTVPATASPSITTPVTSKAPASTSTLPPTSTVVITPSTTTTGMTATTAVNTPSVAPITLTSLPTAPTTPKTTATVVPTSSVSPVFSTQTPVVTTATTQTPVATSTPTVATVPATQTTVTTTATSTVVTTVTTPTPAVISSTTTAPRTTVTTTTTQPPVVTTQTTQTPIVTTPTTSTPTLRTSVPTTPTPLVTTVVSTTPSTAGPVTSATTVTPAQPGSSPTTQAPITSPSTVPVVTQPATSPTTPAVTNPTAPAVTTLSTAAPTTPTTVRTTPTTTRPTTTTTTTTTQAPSTTTQSSSVISLALPAVLTILFAFF